jgi:general stress protein CsbA
MGHFFDHNFVVLLAHVSACMWMHLSMWVGIINADAFWKYSDNFFCFYYSVMNKKKMEQNSAWECGYLLLTSTGV